MKNAKIARIGLALAADRKTLRLLLLSGFLAVACQAVAQERLLTGTVKDVSGAVVPDAKVVVADESFGLVRTVTCDHAGNFSVTKLSPGNYTVTVTAPGFYKTVQKGVKITPATAVSLEIRLDVSRAPNYLARIKKPFGMGIERVTHSRFERDLIEKAEHVPCPGGEWTNQKGNGVRWPRCLNGDALDYYVNLLKRYEGGDFGFSSPVLESARAFYHASAMGDSTKHDWKVELVLEYADYCGNVCGQGFEIIRTIYFDKDMRIIKIEGDNEGAHGWIA